MVHQHRPALGEHLPRVGRGGGAQLHLAGLRPGVRFDAQQADRVGLTVFEPAGSDVSWGLAYWRANAEALTGPRRLSCSTPEWMGSSRYHPSRSRTVRRMTS